MRSRDPMLWVWAEALELLRGAERQQRRVFALTDARAVPCWEPSVDVFERAGELTLLVALPGVCAGQVEVNLDGNRLVIRGQRPIPAAFHGSSIHRLEIPYGRFERRIELPSANFRLLEQGIENGCLTLVLRELQE